MYAHITKTVLLCMFIHFAAAAKHELPSYFPVCKRLDPKINDCLLKATETVRPFLIKGVPEIGLPSIEPFVITAITLEQNTRALNFTAHLENVSVKGLSSYKFSQLVFDVPKLIWWGKMTVGTIDITGNYNVTGTVLGAPIRGKGKFVASMASTDIGIFPKVSIVKRKNVDHLRSVFNNVTMIARGPKLQLDGLFDGDVQSNRVITNIINDNINELFEDLRPVIEQIIANIAQQWLSKSLEQNIPFDKLYPKN